MGYLLTDAGKAIIASRIKGDGTEPVYIAWGTGTTEPTTADTTLEAEAAEARVTGVSSVATTNVADDTYQVTGAMASESVQEITEWGLFDAATDGNMLLREVLNPGHELEIGGILNFLFKIVVSECDG